MDIALAKTESAGSADELIGYLDHPTSADIELVRSAYAFAHEVHAGHVRLSGEPYFNHLYATALALAEFGMGARTVSAGLLHDCIEDRGVSEEELNQRFGPEVLFLVKGVTKLGALKYRGAQRHVESLRRLFIATSQDIRVLIIKLMDRLHNMRTLEHVPTEKRKRIASETLEIYAPLADRLGMGTVKRDLEDLAFPHLYPVEYARTVELMRERKQAKEPYLEDVVAKLKKELATQNIKSFRTDYRRKGYYSLYKKLERKGGDIEKIFDIMAIRVIVPTMEDCYRVLGVVHGTWRPLPGKVKDYIALPKPNGYRSIHTTVFTHEAGPIEIQIRSEEMHREAQFGFASHLSYKEIQRGDRGVERRNRLWYRYLIPSLLHTRKVEQLVTGANIPRWVNELAVAHGPIVEGGGDQSFLEELKEDFFSHRVFVFTPKGDVVDLPLDSSPIDFAYAIHSDIGDHMSGAKVNGKLASLDTALKNGDIVEIEVKPASKPSKKWLEYVKTSMARKHIHNALQKNQRAT